MIRRKKSRSRAKPARGQMAGAVPVAASPEPAQAAVDPTPEVVTPAALAELAAAAPRPRVDSVAPGPKPLRAIAKGRAELELLRLMGKTQAAVAAAPREAPSLVRARES